MDVFNFKCKYCGGELNEVEGLKSVGKCKYCGSKQTLPKLENEKRANLFERANHLRRNNEFDKAEALYEQLLNEDLTDPEAYWSLVLCRYGIEYVEDKRTGERLPTVNRMQMVSILADEDYKSAIANADAEQKVLYEEEAKLINEIQKGILEIARREEPFDIFICYKETDADGRRSRDSILAQDLYHELTRDGYKVFFARVTLQGKLGSAYEPYIFSALNSAKVMVVLGTQKEHFEAVWVRNEWSRFLGQIKKGERKVLIPAYRDMDAYDLPVEFSNLQALDMSRLGFLQELVEGVENILKAYKKKEAPKAEPTPEPAPAPTYAPPQNPAPEKKKKSKAPIVIIAMILALAIGGGALFMSGALDTIFGGESETEDVNGDVSEKPTESETKSASELSTQETEPVDIPESDTYTETADEEEIAVENPVTVINEGTAYYGVLAHRNLGKLVYLNGLRSGEYYLGIADEVGFGAKLYFEKSPTINYYMYFLSNGEKCYVNANEDGSYISLSIDMDARTVWHLNETYACIMTNINGELCFLGTSDTGTYNNVCIKRLSEGESFFKVQLISADGGDYETSTDGVIGDVEETEPVVTEPVTLPETESETDSTTEPDNEPMKEDVAYYGVLDHKNLNKSLYLNGVMDGYYLGATDDKTLAACVYFEKADELGYYMFFRSLDSGAKSYVNVNEDGQHLNLSLDSLAVSVWYFNEEYQCPMTTVSGAPVFLGTSDTGVYQNICVKRLSEGASYFKLILQEVNYSSGEQLSFALNKYGNGYEVTGIGSVTGSNVVIPSTYNGLPVISIAKRAFDYNTDLKTIYIPKSIKFIDEYAFNNCIFLSQITYEGNYEEWLEINTSIFGNDALRGEGVKMVCEQIAEEIPRENYDFSFVWAENGESYWVCGLWEYDDPSYVVIPTHHKGLMVTGIHSYAFQAQDAITKVYIPSSVSYIGENAFIDCPNIATVQFEGTSAEWSNMDIRDGNYAIENADIVCGVMVDGECTHLKSEVKNCTVFCADCGATIDTEHQSTELVESVDPTESKGGYIKYKCNECGETWTETFPPLGNGDSGSGSEKTVMSAEELKALITQINNGEVSNDITIIIGDNIDFDGLYFEPIHEFRGTIDGNGKTISNITLTENGASVSVRDGNGSEYNAMAIGFIGKAYGVTVRDLTLDSVMADISTAQNIYIGALAGYADGIVIEDSTITSNLVLKETGRAGTSGVAGVIGYSLDALMERVNVDATIDHTAQSGESHTGAILGAGNVRIHNCTIDLAVKFIGQNGAGHAGWLIGREYTDADVDCATLRDSTVTGTFEASNCMYAWGEVGQGYFYIEHGEQIDIYEYNTKIDVK